MDRSGKITTHTHMQQRIDTAENWSADNPVLYEGEIGYESQPETSGKLLPPKIKIGDGKTAWNDLPYQENGEGSFKAYVTSAVTINAGEEKTFHMPASDNVLTQVYEVSDGGAHDNTNIAFDSAEKYSIDGNEAAVGMGSAQLKGGLDQYTKLLLHFNGTSASTTVIDSSPSSAAITNHGVTIDTSNYKLAGESGYFNGSSYLNLGNNENLFLKDHDFTLEAWVYPKSYSDYPSIIDCWPYSNTNYSYDMRPYSTNFKGHFLFTYSTTGSDFHDLDSGVSIPLNTWTHLAVSRNGANLYMFVNGRVVKTYDIGSAYINDTKGNFMVGYNYNPNSTLYDGYIQELRVSIGIARWTSDFTLPKAEYNMVVSNMPCNITTTDSSNYLLSKVSKINSLTIPVNVPANTSVKILTSFDGRKTWLYHDNSGWHSFGTISSEWTTSNSNEELQNYFTNLSMSKLAADLGYTPTTIDFIFQLETTDASVTPVVFALTLNYSSIGGLEGADVGSYDDTVSRYGLRITDNTHLSIKNKDTSSHTVNLYIVPLNNVTFLN